MGEQQMRKLTGFTAAALMGCAILASPSSGVAQDYPDQAITWIVPSSAGSGFDVISRIITPKFSELIGQPVVIENIAGAGATVGAATAAEAKPDGHTILLINSNHTAAEALYKSLSYNLLTSFDPVVRFTTSYHVFVTKNDLDVKTLDDVIAMAKAKPGELNFASAGIGSVTFMCTELLKSQAGIDMTHIPYEGGGPAIASVVAGETDFYGAPYSTGKQFIEDGQVRALAVTSKERLPFLPDLPTASESVPGFEFMSFYGLVVPKGTPVEIRDKIRATLAETLADPKVKQQLADLGSDPIEEGPEEFAAYLAKEVETTKKLVKDAGIEPK
jgi:tripartite-type tricarboxylate transporter receptor subunit TctC